MARSEIEASGATDTIEVDDEDKLDTFVRETIKIEPSHPFTRANNNSSTKFFRLLHHLYMQSDKPEWPLVSPFKIELQKCDKCSQKFCSTINYKRHELLHDKSLNLDKDSTTKNKLAGFWNKLSTEEAMEIISLRDVSLEGVSELSIVKALTSFIANPGFVSLPQSYGIAGYTLLNLVQAKPSSFPLPFQRLQSILSDASENTFLVASTAESLKKHVFDREAVLELRNLVASISFLAEQKLVKAFDEKEAEAKKNEELLLAEEAADQSRQAARSQKKKQKKLRQKERRAQKQASEETESSSGAETDFSPGERSPSLLISSYAEASDSNIKVPEVSDDEPVSSIEQASAEIDFSPAERFSSLAISSHTDASDLGIILPDASDHKPVSSLEQASAETDFSPEERSLSLPISSHADAPDSNIQVPEVSQNPVSSHEPVQMINLGGDVDKGSEMGCLDSGTDQGVEHKRSDQKRAKSFHSSQNYQVQKPGPTKEHFDKDSRAATAAKYSEVWEPKQKSETDEDSYNTSLQVEAENPCTQDKVLIGAIPVPLGNLSSQRRGKNLGEAHDKSTAKDLMPGEGGLSKKPDEIEATPGTGNPPVSRRDNEDQESKIRGLKENPSSSRLNPEAAPFYPTSKSHARWVKIIKSSQTFNPKFWAEKMIESKDVVVYSSQEPTRPPESPEMQVQEKEALPPTELIHHERETPPGSSDMQEQKEGGSPPRCPEMQEQDREALPSAESEHDEREHRPGCSEVQEQVKEALQSTKLEYHEREASGCPGMQEQDKKALPSTEQKHHEHENPLYLEVQEQDKEALPSTESEHHERDPSQGCPENQGQVKEALPPTKLEHHEHEALPEGPEMQEQDKKAFTSACSEVQEHGKALLSSTELERHNVVTSADDVERHSSHEPETSSACSEVQENASQKALPSSTELDVVTSADDVERHSSHEFKAPSACSEVQEHIQEISSTELELHNVVTSIDDVAEIRSACSEVQEHASEEALLPSTEEHHNVVTSADDAERHSSNEPQTPSSRSEVQEHSQEISSTELELHNVVISAADVEGHSSHEPKPPSACSEMQEHSEEISSTELERHNVVTSADDVEIYLSHEPEIRSASSEEEEEHHNFVTSVDDVEIYSSYGPEENTTGCCPELCNQEYGTGIPPCIKFLHFYLPISFF